MGESISSLDPERLARRIRFLRSRADAHVEATSDSLLNQACAATLLRDAACVSLLVGNVGEARELLRDAGLRFLRLGLAIGSTMIALSQTRDTKGELEGYSDVVEGVRQQWSRAESRDRSESRQAMTETARESPRQMFSVLQTEWLVSEVDGRRSIRDDSSVHVALERNAGYPAGETGLSIDSYANIADWMVGHRGSSAFEAPSFITAAMSTVAMTRTERIRAAMKDGYHWRMVPRPTELLDLDAVVLMFIALGAGMSQDTLEALQRTDVPLVDAPLKAAVQLRSDQELSPRPPQMFRKY